MLNLWKIIVISVLSAATTSFAVEMRREQLSGEAICAVSNLETEVTKASAAVTFDISHCLTIGGFFKEEDFTNIKISLVAPRSSADLIQTQATVIANAISTSTRVRIHWRDIPSTVVFDNTKQFVVDMNNFSDNALMKFIATTKSFK